MTMGVYKLTFSDGSFYIGRSSNIEKRLSTHKNDIKNGRSNKKLLSAYTRTGLPICIVVIEECTTIESSIDREVFWIRELKAIEYGLNVSEGGEDILQGDSNPHSKYSNEEIYSVLKYIISGMPLKEVSDKLNISYNVVRDISAGNEHLWLQDTYPKEYQTLVSQRKERKANSLSNLTDKFRFKALLGTYPELLSPQDVVTSIPGSLSSFATEHGLHIGNLSQVINGKRKSCQGWKLYKENTS